MHWGSPSPHRVGWLVGAAGSGHREVRTREPVELGLLSSLEFRAIKIQSRSTS